MYEPQRILYSTIIQGTRHGLTKIEDRNDHKCEFHLYENHECVK